MELMQTLATIFALLIILKIVVIFFLSKKTLQKTAKLYNSKTISFFYYLYLGIGCILLYLLIKEGVSYAEILSITFIGILIYVSSIIKIFGKQISKVITEYDSFFDIIKSIWLYIIVILFLCIMALIEIYHK